VKRQQRKPLDVAKGEEKDNWSDEEQLSDGDDDDLTNLPASLTTDNAKSIKMRFLDRLAEILCRDKHASYVTCTSMLEREDDITIVAARNTKWGTKLLSNT
jgi:hypothetical protein